MSEALQERIFRLFVVSNARGERKDLVDVFASYYGCKRLPPAGTGECCAPKLLQYAYGHHLQPVCMAEFCLPKQVPPLARLHVAGARCGEQSSCPAKC